MGDLTQRDAFFGEICRLARSDRDIVVISADQGAPALDPFRRDMGDRFVNVGIAEQNAITVGAGLALCGKKVFVYAIAPFITLRCLEQIRVEGSIMGIPLNIVGVGAGLSYDDSGPTHHALEDVAVLRAFPRITVHNVTDAVMAASLAVVCCESPALRYVRLDRELLPDLYSPSSDFRKGYSVIKKHKDAYIIATGSMTHAAIALASELGNAGIGAGVIDLHTFPVDGKRLARTLSGIRKIVSIEEHFLPGGLGGALAEIVADLHLPVRLKRIGLSPAKGYSYAYGGREEIRRSYGLDLRRLRKTVADFLSGADE